MNILVIHRNAQIGGANTYLRAVVPELRRRGHTLELMIGGGPCRPLLQEAFGRPLAWNPPLPWLAARLVPGLVRRRQIEAVNAHTYKTGLAVLAACRAAGIPLIQHVHSLVPLAEAAPALQAADRIIVMNRAVRDWVAQVEGLAAKTVLSVLPVDPARFHPRPTDRTGGFRILYCGRLARRKAAVVGQILQVLGELATDIPEVELVVVGGRSHRADVARQASRVNSALGREAVIMHGELLEPADTIAAADLVIGTGYVALEALACARYVIGVGIQGLTGLVTDKNVQACLDANFGDHAALDPAVTPAKLKQEILQAYHLWLETPSAPWGAELIAREFTPRRVADDLEQALIAVAM